MCWWSSRSGYFYSDDFIEIGDATREGLRPHYLNSLIFGHWVPAKRVIGWIVQLHKPLSWEVVQLLFIVVLILAALSMRSLLYKLTRDSLTADVLAGLLPLTGTVLSSVTWYAGGMHPIAALPCLIASCNMSLGFLRGGGRRAFTLALAAATLGALFDERVAPLCVLFLVFAYLHDRTSGSVTGTAYVQMASGHIAVFITWYIFQRRAGAVQTDLNINDHGLIISAVSHGFFRSVVPGIFGLYMWPTYSTFRTDAQYLLGRLAFAVACIRVSLARSWAVAIAVGWFLLATILVLLPVAILRAPQFGPLVTASGRYSVLLAPFGLIVLALLIGRTGDQHVGRRPSRGAVICFAAITAVVAVVHVVRPADQFFTKPSRAYVERLQATASAHQDLPFFDEFVPESVVPRLVSPGYRLSRLVALVAPGHPNQFSHTRGLKVLPDGTAIATRLVDITRGSMNFTSGVVVAGQSTEKCLTGTSSSRSLMFRFEPQRSRNSAAHLIVDGRLFGDDPIVDIEVGTTTDTLRPMTDQLTPRSFAAENGLVVLPTFEIEVNVVRFTVKQSSTLCVTSVSLGRVAE